MRAVFLVPRRADNGHRDRLWAFCRAKWERELPDIPIFEGHHEDGPFNRAAAINAASDLAGDWDVGIVIDADVMLDPAQVRRAVEQADAAGKVVWAFTQWRGLTKEGTQRVLAGESPDRDAFTEKLNPISWSCCFAIPRRVWDDIGGFDERFRGWGWEDMAFKVSVLTLHGAEHLPGMVTHLWHPRSEERAEIRRPDGYVLITPEYYDNTRLGTTYMAVEGVKGKVRDLIRDAKAARAARKIGTTVVVMTNGRAEYVEQAIASASAHLRGTIAKRVIWDDTGSTAYRVWLQETFPDWFQIGPVEHLGFGRTVEALWSYLVRRCQAPYVFLLEEDFVIERDVDLDDMARVLHGNPHLAQLALLRHAAYPRELEAPEGAILHWPAESFTPQRMNGYGWLEHRNFWTNNPTLFRRSLCRTEPWRPVPNAESAYGKQLFRDSKVRSAFWGAGEPWVRHIGVERAPNSDGY